MSTSFLFDLTGYVVLCAIAGYGLTGLARSIAGRVDWPHQPDASRNRRGRPIPSTGGVAVYLTVFGACIAADALQPDWLAQDPAWTRLFPTLLISAGVVCLVGLWNDKRSMRRRTKFLWQLAAALPWAIAGPVADTAQIPGISIGLGVLSFAFTVFWLMACANILNLIDRQDGLAGTVGLIVSATAIVAALNGGRNGAVFVAAVLAASLAGFLLHNWPPARSQLGDSGKLTLGFLLGALSLETSTKQVTGLILAVPVIPMYLSFFKTVMTVGQRKMTGLVKTQRPIACRSAREHVRAETIWAELCELAQAIGADSMQLTCRDGRTDAVIWQGDWTRSTERIDAQRIESTCPWKLNYSLQTSDQSPVAVTLHGTSDCLPKEDRAAQWIQLVGTFADVWSRQRERRWIDLQNTHPPTLHDEAA